MLQNKQGYFQGGGGVNEPTPKKKKYKSDKAIAVQPRFKEPFYRNYDLYETEGVDGPAKQGPGAGLYQNMEKYKSVKDFIDKKRKRNKDKYKADDSYIEDTESNRKERISKMKIRAKLLNRIIKTSNDENADYMLPPKEHGTSIYNWKNSPYQGIPKAPKRHDSHKTDFPIDDQINSDSIHFNEETVQPLWYLGPEGPPGDTSTFPNSPNLGDESVYPYSAEIGGDGTVPYPDFEGKPASSLDFGRDYVEDQEKSNTLDSDSLKYLINKHLTPHAKGLYGLPDGVDLPEEDLGDPTNINPDYGTTDSGNTLYNKMWI